MKRKARIFQITGKSNPDYEDLVNDPLIDIIEIDKYTNFGNYFVCVHYYDLNPRRDDGPLSEESDTPGDVKDGD